MNSIAIYLVGELGLSEWIRENVVRVHLKLPMEWLLGQLGRWTGLADRLAGEGLSPGEVIYQTFAPTIEQTLMFLVVWLCAWALYRRKQFLRI
jgi:hypothetical protein